MEMELKDTREQTVLSKVEDNGGNDNNYAYGEASGDDDDDDGSSCGAVHDLPPFSS